VRIEVTAEDVRAGARSDSGGCPVALALRRATGGQWWVGGRGLRPYFPAPPHGDVVDAPPQVARFVDDYDSGLPVSPFSFELEVGPCASR
jgi:hypothetical protein